MTTDEGSDEDELADEALPQALVNKTSATLMSIMNQLYRFTIRFELRNVKIFSLLRCTTGILSIATFSALRSTFKAYSPFCWLYKSQTYFLTSGYPDIRMKCLLTQRILHRTILHLEVVPHARRVGRVSKERSLEAQALYRETVRNPFSTAMNLLRPAHNISSQDRRVRGHSHRKCAVSSPPAGCAVSTHPVSQNPSADSPWRR
jgi:hypothetical protein